ncbi:transcriptional regulator [Paraburkholderia monticola]|uniref:Transcriptional regulator n=1 Tax=Paraburkholderia monticola TaxID=1399968 RepID=A0A149PFM8_9BURK|nr:AAA family ATPase [Paraburkholderia monticola]KXU83850.1 transcriptional regulator [Paraburkholderia monticola]
MGDEGIGDTASANLSICLLGEIEVRRDGAGMSLPASRRTRALLAYLVSCGGAVARSTLCDLLWDGPDDPRAALRWSLTKLRPLVDDALHTRIVASRTHVAFDAAGAFIDTTTVTTLLASVTEAMPLATLERAAVLLRGDFVSGLDLPSCYRFHNWCVSQREHFGRMRKTVLRALIGRMGGDPVAAVQRGRELVEADPLDETTHATLIRLLHGAGRHADAENHYAYAHELLRRELGAASCTTLDDQIRHIRQDLRTATVKDEPAHGDPREIVDDQRSLPAPPLVGRGEERMKLDALLTSPLASGGLTLLAGEPGIGKTRLLDYFSARASSAGFIVLRGRCYEVETIRPYGIWIDALHAVAPDILSASDEALTPLLRPMSARTPEIQQDEGNRERFFEAVVALLGRLCDGHRLAIVLDDLHWLDEASAALLHFVLRRLDGRPIAFLAAARIAEADDNRWARTLLQSFSREGKLARVLLSPLSVTDVETLLATSGTDMLREQAARESGGNPLYLLELTRARNANADDAARSINTLIADRLAPLAHATRELLSFAAVIGRGFTPEQLAGLLERPLREILPCLTELERRGLIAPATEAEFDFAHDLVRQAVYRTLSQPHKRAMHHQIARQLLAASKDDPRLHGEVVHHATLADDSLMTARACVEASNYCLHVFAVAEARSVAERGLAHVRALPRGSERIRLQIQLLTARVVAAASSGDTCPALLEEEFERAIQDAEALSLHAEVVQGLHSLSWITQQANDIERTRQVTIRAESAARKADTTTRCKQLANTGRCLLELERDLPRARSVLHEAGAMAERRGLHVVELMWGEALLARADGKLDIACASLTDAVSQAHSTGEHWREYQCLVWLAMMNLERGAYAEVIRLAGAIVEAAQKMGDSGAPFTDVLGNIASLRLAGDEPLSQAFDALDALRQADDKRHLCYALNEAALVSRDWGCAAKARAYATEALAAAEVLHSTTEMIVATAVLIDSALTAGEAEQAEPHLRSLRNLLNERAPSPRADVSIRRLCSRFPAITTAIPTQTQ